MPKNTNNPKSDSQTEQQETATGQPTSQALSSLRPEIFVKPNGIVRRPEMGYSILPEKGANVPDNPYYRRLSIQGALEIIDAKNSEEKKGVDKNSQNAKDDPASADQTTKSEGNNSSKDSKA